MAFPRQVEIEQPLLEVLAELGGQAKPREVYPLVARRFPKLSAEEQEERLENYPSIRKWSNLVQWVRQRLVDAGEIDGSQRGIWRLTDAGRARLTTKAKVTKIVLAPPVPVISLRDLRNTNVEEVKGGLLSSLKELTPRGFEHFCREFLAHLGYRNVEVTRRSQDGGIDGHGDFRQGAISIRSAFQAKRWTDNAVGRPEIDKFRGAIQGDFDHGVFLTTSRFSKDAKAASYKKGAITILLLDGAAITELLVERGLGVRKLPLFIYDLDEEFFDLNEE
ncbi:MAG: restriction endonuclease [Acidobacteriota bacterium]|nr:restriction endonuclease [Acidobacteriota bacterium]